MTPRHYCHIVCKTKFPVSQTQIINRSRDALHKTIEPFTSFAADPVCKGSSISSSPKPSTETRFLKAAQQLYVCGFFCMTPHFVFHVCSKKTSFDSFFHVVKHTQELHHLVFFFFYHGSSLLPQVFISVKVLTQSGQIHKMKSTQRELKGR